MFDKPTKFSLSKYFISATEAIADITATEAIARAEMTRTTFYKLVRAENL